MILQALYDYYQRSELAPPGWEKREIPFVIVLNREGRFVMIEDRTDDQNKRGRPLLMPASETRSGVNAWMKPNLMWDHYGFVLGIQKHKPNGNLDPTDTPEKAERQRRSFADRISKLQGQFPESAGLQSLKSFYERGEYKGKGVENDPALRAVLKIPGANLSFRLVDSADLIAHEPWVSDYLIQTDDKSNDDEDSGLSEIGTCLVTGKPTEIARLHPKIRGVSDKPAPLLSANTAAYPSYSSYGKSQGFLFPVGKPAAIAYATALNHLLEKGSRNRFQVGDAATVCWAEQQGEAISEYDSVLADIFGQHDDPDAGVQAVTTLFKSLQSGRFDGVKGKTRYFVLGLAPNAARISVRFFHTMTLAELAPRILQHFEDIRIAHPDSAPPLLTVRRLLQSLCLETKAQPNGDMDRLPPNVGGALINAILADRNAPYPHQLINLSVMRCRAEREVTYPRAATIKGSLNRLIRRNLQEKEFQPMLDPDNPNVAYRLGRLFAVLEKIQEEASGGSGRLNSTIRDRYYGAASSSPGTVFPMLLKLKNHHISKLDDRGSRMLYRAFQDHKPDDYIGTVLWGPKLNELPAHLALQDQGRFALGYYHQRQAFFTKSDKTESTEEKQ